MLIHSIIVSTHVRSFMSHNAAHVLIFYRGILTGKFKRNSNPDKSGSRIGFVTSNQSFANQAAPTWSKYDNDEEFWNLMNILEKIAQTHGMVAIS